MNNVKKNSTDFEDKWAKKHSSKEKTEKVGVMATQRAFQKMAMIPPI